MFHDNENEAGAVGTTTTTTADEQVKYMKLYEMLSQDDDDQQLEFKRPKVVKKYSLSPNSNEYDEIVTTAVAAAAAASSEEEDKKYKYEVDVMEKGLNYLNLGIDLQCGRGDGGGIKDKYTTEGIGAAGVGGGGARRKNMLHNKIEQFQKREVELEKMLEKINKQLLQLQSEKEYQTEQILKLEKVLKSS